MDSRPTTAPETPSGGPLRHLPAVDGTRGLFLTLFLLGHLGLTILPGAWIGIDMFFALSGYLIIRLLIEHHGRTGRVAILGFYQRRARRLLPALFAVLTVLVGYGLLVADEIRRQTLGRDILATLGFVQNWNLIAQSDAYFEHTGTPSMLRHAWTLAVEEQFYVLAPFLVAALVVLVRGRAVRSLILLGLALASVVWLSTFDVDDVMSHARVYYGTDTRVSSILLGAALGSWMACDARGKGPPVLPHRLVVALGWAGLTILLAAFVLVSPYDWWLWNAGGLFLITTCGVVGLLVVIDHRPSSLASMLSVPPLVWIGVRTYGIYLYSWPIQLMVAEAGAGTLVTAAATIALTFALAGVSYRYLERPVMRHGVRALLPRTSLAHVITPIAALALVVGSLAVGRAQPPADAAVAVGGSEATRVTLAPDQPAYVPGSTEVTVGLLGDSVPKFLVESFPAEVYSDLDVVDLTEEACGLIPLPIRWSDEITEPPLPGCVERNRSWAGEFERGGADVLVVFAPSFLLFDHVTPDGAVAEQKSPALRRLALDRLDELWAQAQAAGADQAQVVTIPCRRPESVTGVPPEMKDAVASLQDGTVVTWANDVLTDWVADTDGAELLDLHGVLCGDGFRKEVNGVELYADRMHFSAEARSMVWTWLAPRMRDTYLGRDDG